MFQLEENSQSTSGIGCVYNDQLWGWYAYAPIGGIAIGECIGGGNLLGSLETFVCILQKSNQSNMVAAFGITPADDFSSLNCISIWIDMQNELVNNLR